MHHHSHQIKKLFQLGLLVLPKVRLVVQVHPGLLTLPKNALYQRFYCRLPLVTQPFHYLCIILLHVSLKILYSVRLGGVAHVEKLYLLQLVALVTNLLNHCYNLPRSQKTAHTKILKNLDKILLRILKNLVRIKHVNLRTLLNTQQTEITNLLLLLRGRQNQRVRYQVLRTLFQVFLKYYAVHSKLVLLTHLHHQIV